MNGSKTLKLLGALGGCALALVLGTGSSVLWPADAGAASCICGPIWNTVTEWGMGSTCAAAILDFESNAEEQAHINCGLFGRDVCSLETPTHGACYVVNGMYKVDGQQRYKCVRCPGDPVIP